ncbi:MAG: O-antigen ligase family protein [Acidimicrobiales bacterium]|nr:O-antigen ligase family protein [Actinomycetota bacterium]
MQPTPAPAEVGDSPASSSGAAFGDDHAGRAQIPRWMLLAILIVAQALFARFMSQQPSLGVIQAVAIILLILYGGIRRNVAMLLCVTAYLPGAEITWRQSQVPIPYMLAPYLMIGVALLAITTSYPHLNRVGRLAVMYFLLMLPASLITYSTAPAAARQLVAFALAGPAALAALVALCSQLTIHTWLYRRILWIMLISGIGPIAIALTAITDYIGNYGAIDFATESNFITSGGFGPVQVSSLMGLTVLVGLLLVLVEDEFLPRLLAGAVALLSMVQSFLTFSRGGMFATAIAGGALALSQATDRRGRRRVLLVVLATFAVGYFVVIPRVDAYTQGQFDKRFGTTETGRTTLASGDLRLFRNNLLLGAGTGMSKYRNISYETCRLRTDRCNTEAASHTEFTRVLAEHGLAGVATIVLMGMMILHGFRRAGPSLGLTVCFVTWAIAQMFYANLRIAAVPFAFAFAFVRVRSEPDPAPPDDDADPALAPAGP